MLILNKLNTITSNIDGVLTDKYVTISAASSITGYNKQYLRRLLRNGRLSGIHVGQTWLIHLESLDGYINEIKANTWLSQVMN